MVQRGAEPFHLVGIPNPRLADKRVRTSLYLGLWGDGRLLTRDQRLFTRSRMALPGLKCGTCVPGKATTSPVFGLRPMWGAR